MMSACGALYAFRLSALIWASRLILYFQTRSHVNDSTSFEHARLVAHYKEAYLLCLVMTLNRACYARSLAMERRSDLLAMNRSLKCTIGRICEKL